VRPSFSGPLTDWDGGAAGGEGGNAAAGGGGGEAGQHRSPRRLVLTARALLERRTDSYEVLIPCFDVIAFDF